MGTDEFSYKVSDCRAESNTATVTVNVNGDVNKGKQFSDSLDC
jgi:hypothetical protein